jgi:hypothetical protein
MKTVLALDDGNFFDKNGLIKEDLGLQYFKAKEWRINPTRKGPVPANLKYCLPEGTKTF